MFLGLQMQLSFSSNFFFQNSSQRKTLNIHFVAPNSTHVCKYYGKNFLMCMYYLSKCFWLWNSLITNCKNLFSRQNAKYATSWNCVPCVTQVLLIQMDLKPLSFPKRKNSHFYICSSCSLYIILLLLQAPLRVSVTTEKSEYTPSGSVYLYSAIW